MLTLAGFIAAAVWVDDFSSLLVGWVVGIITAVAFRAQYLEVGGEAAEDDGGSNWRDRPFSKRAQRPRPVSLAASGNWPPPAAAIDAGGGLSFTYADANGEITERRILNWKEDPEYDHCFTGWCTDREEPRTFRIDRVLSWGR